MKLLYALNKSIRTPQLPLGILGACLFGILVLNPARSSAQTVLNPTADAMVYQGSSATNYGTDTRLLLKRKIGSAITRTAYLKFDLTGVTPVQAARATLRLYCNTKAFNDVPSVVSVYNTSDSWTEAGLNWSNAPVAETSNATTDIAAQGTFYEWDVTALVQNALSTGTIANFNLADISASNNTLEFSSREGANPPQLVLSAFAAPQNVTYFVDPDAGDDNNDGQSMANAWKSINKVNTTYFAPGCKVLLKSGSQLNGILNIGASGTAGNPIIFDIYGGSEPASINGQGNTWTVYSYNRAQFELRNIRVTNFSTGTISASSPFSGIYLANENGGKLSHIVFDHVVVDSVNSSNDESGGNTVYNGGVQFYSYGSRTPSYFDDVLIQNCTFKNLSRTGFNFRSDWDQRNHDTNFGDDLGDGTTDNWTPNTNVRILANTFKNIAGNGLILRVAKNALVEGNLFDSCGTIISGNAAFNFNTDSTVFQYNEAKNTVYNDGDTDARGIDADFRTENTVIQFNYLHDNGLGGVVATGGNEGGQVPERYNIGTAIRYNVVENNQRQGIYFSGAVNGLDVYNNVFFADANHNDIDIVKLNKWSVTPQNVRFQNNIFYYLGSNLSYTFITGSTYSFNNNIYYGTHPASEPADPNKITANPLLLNPGGGPDGYKLLENSPAIGTGVIIANNGGMDYYGNQVPSATQPNIGLFNGTALSTLPVQFIKFTARKNGTAALLEWATGNEQNSLRFDVERSADGIHFSKIAELAAAGNASNTTNYSYTDRQPATGYNYYRLTQRDRDGKQTISPVRALNFAVTGLAIQAYPNPVADWLHVEMDQVHPGAVTLSVFSIDGKKVDSRVFPDATNIQFSVKTLPRGIYSIELAEPSGTQLARARFLKM